MSPPWSTASSNAVLRFPPAGSGDATTTVTLAPPSLCRWRFYVQPPASRDVPAPSMQFVATYRPVSTHAWDGTGNAFPAPYLERRRSRARSRGAARRFHGTPFRFRQAAFHHVAERSLPLSPLTRKRTISFWRRLRRQRDSASSTGDVFGPQEFALTTRLSLSESTRHVGRGCFPRRSSRPPESRRVHSPNEDRTTLLYVVDYSGRRGQP